jgi:hypothetical protein
MPRLFEWTFGKDHFLVDEGYHVILAEDKDDIVGFLGGIPFELNEFGATKRGVWLANYLVRSDYRRGSLGLQLLNVFRNSHPDAVVAFGVNASVLPIYRMLKADVLTGIPRHFAVLPHARERMRGLLRVARPEWSREKADSVIDAFTIPPALSSSSSFTTALPEDWDRVGWPVLAARTVGCARNADYLRWRYFNHPCFEYRIITVRDADQIGIAIWRLETIRACSERGGADLDIIGRLVEFLAPSRHIAGKLWEAYCFQLTEVNALGTDYYGYHGETGTWLRDLGFQCVDRHPEGHAIPTRFQPLDGRGGTIMSAVFLNSSLPKCRPGTDCAWYWTKSDADQDRPN